MQEVETQHVIEQPTYPSAPPSGGPFSRLRWSALLGGVAVFLAVALFLWGLAFAIIVLASHPTAASMRGSGIAIWITAIVSTILGAAAGGAFAGRSIWGSSAGWGAAHGFAVWAVSLLLAFGVQFFLFRGVLTAAMFHTMGIDDTGEMQQGQGDTGQGTAQDERAAAVARDYFVAAGWSWVGTWLIAGVAATAAAAAASSGTRRTLRGHAVRESTRIYEADRGPLTRSPAE
jgi:hypothetical protein